MWQAVHLGPSMQYRKQCLAISLRKAASNVCVQTKPAALVGDSPKPLEHLSEQLSYAIENRYFLPRPFFGNMLLYEVEYFSTSVVKN